MVSASSLLMVPFFMAKMMSFLMLLVLNMPPNNKSGVTISRFKFHFSPLVTPRSSTSVVVPDTRWWLKCRNLLNQGFISTAISLSGIPAGLLNVLIISEDGTLIYSGKLIKQ